MESRNYRSSRWALRVLLGLLAALLAFESYVWVSAIVAHGGMAEYLADKRRDDALRFAVDVVNDHYVGGPVLDGSVATDDDLSKLVSRLDPYSQYMDQKQMEWLREETDQRFGGIGVRVEMRDGFLTVLAPMENTPGERAGLQRGDRIVEVNGRPVSGLGFVESVSGLRGQAGSKVSVAIERPRTGERFDALLERAVIPVPSVRDAHMLSPDIGYLRIEQFGTRTSRELMDAIDHLLAQGMGRLILDLRGNPGGLLDAAVAVVSPFLEKGQLVVYTQGRDGKEQDRREVRRQSRQFDFPLVALVNGGTASASEIVAGALKDWGRATLVGQTTFGKGSVQSIIELSPQKALRLTTAKYYTPGGYVIDGVGIEPDVVVELDRRQAGQLAAQRRQLEFLSAEEFLAEFGSQPVADPQLEAALRVFERD